MIPVGDRPILWHIMKYYAQLRRHRLRALSRAPGRVIKEYFLDYNEALSNDFVLRDGGRSIELLRSDITDWSITFVNTGLQGRDRAATEAGGALHRRRRGLPRDLRGRAHRRPAAGAWSTR